MAWKKFRDIDAGLSVRLLIIATIFLLSFLTFNVLFKASATDDYFKEIIAALIGTILAAVVTTLLLKSQSQGEELKERNVAVFHRKVEAYEAFLDRVLAHLSDHKVSDEEAHDLRRLVYKMALFSSEDTIVAVSRYVRCKFVEDGEADLSEIVSAFRVELALENVDELSTADLEAVNLLLENPRSRENVETTRQFLQEFAVAFKKALLKYDLPILLDDDANDLAIDGYGDGVFTSLVLSSGANFDLDMTYLAEPDAVTTITAMYNLTDVDAAQAKRIEAAAIQEGFLVDHDEEDGHYPLINVDPSVRARKSVREEGGETIWNLKKLVSAVAKIEAAVAKRGR